MMLDTAWAVCRRKWLGLGEGGIRLSPSPLSRGWCFFDKKGIRRPLGFALGLGVAGDAGGMLGEDIGVSLTICVCEALSEGPMAGR